MSVVILVDEQDNDLGLYDKMAAHKEGLLHRAFSIFIFNSKNQLLLQKRADHKYHSPGLWTNSCCSHDVREYSLLEFAGKRLEEEVGINTDLEEIGTVTYDLDCGNEMRENEFNHLLLGYSDDNPIPNSEEVSQIRYEDIATIKAEIEKDPDQFTSWFKYLLPRVEALI
ncbi:MAG: isopentenyl-diphosphate Delta-isomerase [bacterium]|nr:isopentenyl-diphosphate Delta-isomerase [bacterium]